MKFSVIIPAYNAQHTIGQTLSALSLQDYPAPFEVIVVDDGSTDDTAAIIRSFSFVRYIHQPNAGPAAARNHGARVAQGDILAFTDSDCVPRKDWLSELSQGFVNKEVGVVMGSYGIANPDSLLASCVYQEILFRHERLLSDFPKVFGSYNFCLKKSIFEQVGGFDEGFRNASGEDNDLSYKIISAGWKIHFKRKALVDHHHPVLLKKYLKEQFRHGLWRVRMYAQHPHMAKGDGYTFWKDMAEVPLCGIVLTAFALTLLGYLSFSGLFLYFILPFLFFEIAFAHLMLRGVKEELFWGFVMFLRGFSRTFGLSTGILTFFHKKKINNP